MLLCFSDYNRVEETSYSPCLCIHPPVPSFALSLTHAKTRLSTEFIVDLKTAITAKAESTQKTVAEVAPNVIAEKVCKGIIEEIDRVKTDDETKQMREAAEASKKEDEEIQKKCKEKTNPTHVQQFCCV